MYALCSQWSSTEHTELLFEGYFPVSSHMNDHATFTMHNDNMTLILNELHDLAFNLLYSSVHCVH